MMYLKYAVACLLLLAAGCNQTQDGKAQPVGEVERDTSTDGSAPVKVYILSGQSNMVGIGSVEPGGMRWGKEFIEPVLSIYDSPYNPKADYDKMKPVKTLKLDKFGGVKPTPYPDGEMYVVRGHIQMKESGLYEFRPGYGASTENAMTVDGKEVYRKEPGGEGTHTSIQLEGGAKVPFKIVYFTKNANGLGWWVRMDVPGLLRSAVKFENKFPYLMDADGKWVSRDDVYYKGVVTATADKWLSIGCGARSTSIGPELGFGWVIGDYHDEPVLIIKASQGNRSLGWDFLPPGSERFEHGEYVYAGYKDPQPRWEKGTKAPTEGPWYAGKQYDDCFNAAKEVLDNFDTKFPEWKDRGYEIAGFVWWQGHKDSGNDAHREHYEKNLVQLIKTLRKEFNAPDAPFVVGTVGFHGWEMPETFVEIAKAQLAVDGDAGNHPEFKGNVKTVETRDFWIPADKSPKNQDYHYNQNGETYMRIGLALGKGMVDLLKGK